MSLQTDRRQQLHPVGGPPSIHFEGLDTNSTMGAPVPNKQELYASMQLELNVALNFITSYLYHKLPRRRIYNFAEELARGFERKFEGHWYPDQPFKGSGFRCIRMNGEKVDPSIVQAAYNSGLSMDEISACLPEELTLWIDPGEVSYRLCEKGPVKVLYSKTRDVDTIEGFDKELQQQTASMNATLNSPVFNTESQGFKPIDSLSSSLGNLSISPSSPTPPSWPPVSNGWGSPQGLGTNSPVTSSNSNSGIMNPFIPKSGPPTAFTAASFAQTKFGSTKLKNHAKRPTRLSPTEFQRQQRPPVTPFSNNANLFSRSRSLSPREVRQQELLVEQQKRVLLAQQQQQQFLQGLSVGDGMGLGFPMGAADLGGPRSGRLNNGLLPNINQLGSPDSSKALMDLAATCGSNQFHHLLLAN